ncbi:hypothetical protein Tco_1564611, partial [Tanacetum coccineum]
MVTYTSIYTDSEPRRVYWGSGEEQSDVVPGPKHPPSPDYMPGLEHPPSPVYVPYVPEPKYLKYLVPSDGEAPIEDQPLPVDASPTALSLGYVADSYPEEDLEEDLKEDHANYPVDGGDGNDEPSDDDDDDDEADDKDDEASEDEDDDEEEHLALADSSVVPIVDPVPSTEDTEAFETDESAPTPPSPPRLPQTKLSPLPHILSPPLPISSLPLPLPSPTIDSPTYDEAPLGYRAVRIRIRAASPPLLLISTSYRTDIPEAEMPPRKRACFTTPASRFKVGESSAAGAMGQPGPTLEADLRRDRVR